MKKKLIMWSIVTSCMLVVSLAACAPAAKGTEDANAETTEQTSESTEAKSTVLQGPAYPEDATLEDRLGAMEERAEEYAPKIITLEDGTQVQRTPDVPRGHFAYPNVSTSYNTYYMDGDKRGCMSCHFDGLADLIENRMLQTHIELQNGYGTDVEPMQCTLCHDVGTGYVTANFQFGNLIHGIHKSEAFTGDCMTCHTATSDGNGLRLWEESKYDVLQGFTWIDSEEQTGDFSWEQDTLSETMFSASWMSGDNNQKNIALGKGNVPLDDKVFDEWTLSVTGLVDNPFTMTLPELIATAPIEKIVTTQQCGMNPAGGELIANVEVTGIPISWLLEKAGVQEGATGVMSVAPDGWNRGQTFDKLEERDGYLVYEINGERLKWEQGYPLRTWWPGRPAQAHIRWTGELQVVDTPPDKIKQFKGWYLNDTNTLEFSVDSVQMKYDADAIGTGWNKPNAGVLHFREGQIIEAGHPYEFEGYSYGYDTQITAVEISLDNGKTWTRYDTPDSDLTKWVYWRFTYTPEEPGAYVLAVRGVLADGTVGYLPDKVMFNAK